MAKAGALFGVEDTVGKTGIQGMKTQCLSSVQTTVFFV